MLARWIGEDAAVASRIATQVQASDGDGGWRHDIVLFIASRAVVEIRRRPARLQIAWDGRVVEGEFAGNYRERAMEHGFEMKRVELERKNEQTA